MSTDFDTHSLTSLCGPSSGAGCKPRCLQTTSRGPFSARVLRAFVGTDNKVDQDGLRVYSRHHPMPVPAVQCDKLGFANGYLCDVDSDRPITEKEAIEARNLCLDAHDAVIDQELTKARPDSELEGAFDLLARTTGSMTCQHFAGALAACLSTMGTIHAVTPVTSSEHGDHIQDLLPRKRADIERENQRLVRALPTQNELREWQAQDPMIAEVVGRVERHPPRRDSSSMESVEDRDFVLS